MAVVDNKRIAKNTLLLYARLIVVMAVGLYTSRVVLNALGVNDYGIYNVVGGFVGMFSIISTSLTTAISRFITFELGRNDKNQLRSVFSTTVSIQLFICLVILILSETFGLWFLNNKLNISPDKIYAANWVFQCSVVSLMLSLVNLPYNAAIIAHEKMSAFAYISVLEAAMKLGIAFLTVAFSSNRLIIYAVAFLCSNMILRFIYFSYCKRHFEECHYNYTFDRTYLKNILSFSSWNFIGSSSIILRMQGVNVLLNLFFGTTLNAANGIAQHVNQSVTHFLSGFMAAISPQITKSYASGNINDALALALRGAKFSYYIFFVLSLPILFSTEFILKLWLRNVPDYAAILVQLTLISCLIGTFSHTLVTLIMATGKIRNYELSVGVVQIMVFPISYVAFRLGLQPQSAFYYAIISSCLTLAIKLYLLHKMVGLRLRRYSMEVLLPTIKVSILSCVLPIAFVLQYHGTDFARFILVSALCVIGTITSIYFAGCNSAERQFIKSYIYKFSKNRRSAP